MSMKENLRANWREIVFFLGQVPLAVQPLGITQDPRVLMAQIGQTVTLKCFCGEDSVTFFSWYQQSLGRKPEIISSRMRHNKEAAIYPSFKGRFKVESKETINHLTITDLLLSDSATYYCGILEFNSLEFGEGTFLYVTMPLSNIQGVVYQPALDPVRPGDSVQLSCEAHGEKCKGEQSLYWFRQTKGEPVIMYQNEGNCVDEAHNRKCTLTYSIKSVNSSDEGMYYCALASCGKLVFGNGTQVQLTSKQCSIISLKTIMCSPKIFDRKQFFSPLLSTGKRKQSWTSGCVLLELGVGGFHHPTLCPGFHLIYTEKTNLLCL